MESLGTTFSGAWPEKLVTAIRFYEATIHVAAISMLVLAVFSTGWIGETVVQLSLGAEDVPLPHCQCCLRLLSKCIWCLGAVAHWLVIVVGYLMIIFSVIFVMISSWLNVFALFLNASCKIGDQAVQKLCPVLSWVKELDDAFTEFCSCAGNINCGEFGHNCECDVPWTATPRLSKLCREKDGLFDYSVQTLVGAMFITFSLIGIMGVSLRNRERMSLLTDQVILRAPCT